MKRGSSDRQSQKAQTRVRLLDAALAVFAQRGYQQATVDDIAAGAGHSKGAFYFHFSSKEEIFRELLKLWSERRTARLKVLDSPVPEAALLEGIESFLSYEGRDRSWPPLVLEFWAQGRRDPSVQRALQEAYDSWQRLFTRAFERAARESGPGGLAGAVPAEAAARTVLAAHDGLVVEMCLAQDRAAEGSLRRLVGALLRYLASGAAETSLGPLRTPQARSVAHRRRRPPSVA